MPTQTTYTYSISSAFPNHAVDAGRLTEEIRASVIVTALNDISTSGDNCNVTFKDVVSDADKATLDSLVAAHSGQPLAGPASPVSLTGINTTIDGRLTIRNTTASKCHNFSLRVFSFTFGDPSTLKNLRPSDFSPLSDVTMTCYDSGGAVTTDPTQAVKTVLDFEPTYNYEVIGGWVDLPSGLIGGTTGSYWVSCIGVPDIPSAYGGSIPFVYPVNLEHAFTQKVVSDGRATQYLTYDPVHHTSKLRWIFLHPVSSGFGLQIYVETFV